MPYSDLLKGRRSIPGQAYALTIVTRERIPVFLDFWSARAAITEFRPIEIKSNSKLLCWVLMPDHFHCLIRISGLTNLSDSVRTLKSVTAIAVNRHRKASGPLWQKSYFDRAIRSENDIKPVARYMIANPLRAGLVREIGDYPHWDAIWLHNNLAETTL